MIFRYTLLAILCPVISCFAQSPPVIRPLAVGDTLPDIMIANIYNYPVSKTQLSSFNSKLIILDFWATWCGSCIESFPKLHRLNARFGNDLQLLLVNNDDGDDENKVKRFFEKRKARTGQSFHLPYILHDTVLNRYFPHTGIPHCVWLNNQGKVLAITYASALTEENIHSILNDETVSLPLKNDELIYDTGRPLLVDGNGGNCDEFLYRSIFTTFKEGLGGAIGYTKDSAGKTSRFYVINARLTGLLQIAYPGVLEFSSSRTIVETVVSLDDKFCYEILGPPVAQEEIPGYLQADLFRNFHLQAKNEFRNLGCYVLTAKKNSRISFTRGGIPATDIDKDSHVKFIRNKPVSELIAILDATLDKPVLDETGIKSNIDLILPADLYTATPENLKQFLIQNGFDLVPTTRRLKVAVITDKISSTN